MTVDVCPKRMVFGPCGGVRPAGGCELDAALPCPWGDAADPADPADPAGPLPVRAWDGPTPPTTRPVPGGLLDTATRRPVVLSDLCVPPYDVTTLREVAERLSRHSDALLVPEHHDNPDFPPAMMAAELHRAGARPWITLTCRDRNRVVLEQELMGLAALGVEGVLCVTGDGRGPGVRDDVTGVYDLDSTRLAHLAARAGLVASVAASPASPPAGARAASLAVKQQAGASLVVVNHVRDAGALATFLDRARAAGVDLPVIAGVAVYTDERSARGLADLPGLALDDEAIAPVLAARDPEEAGIAAAVEEARSLLAVPGVVGVNLSGVGSSAGWVPAADIKAEVGRRLAVGAGHRRVVIPVRDRVEVAGDRSARGTGGVDEIGPTGADAALEAEFDTVAAWTEAGGRRARRGPRDPRGVPGIGQPRGPRLARRWPRPARRPALPRRRVRASAGRRRG